MDVEVPTIGTHTLVGAPQPPWFFWFFTLFIYFIYFFNHEYEAWAAKESHGLLWIMETI